MPTTSAMAMARSIGIDPKAFRDALDKQKFAWRTGEGPWVVELDSPEHLQMIGVLRTLLGDQMSGVAKGSAKAAAAGAAKRQAKKGSKKKGL